MDNISLPMANSSGFKRVMKTLIRWVLAGLALYAVLWVSMKALDRFAHKGLIHEIEAIPEEQRTINDRMVLAESYWKNGKMVNAFKGYNGLLGDAEKLNADQKYLTALRVGQSYQIMAKGIPTGYKKEEADAYSVLLEKDWPVDYHLSMALLEVRYKDYEEGMYHYQQAWLLASDTKRKALIEKAINALKQEHPELWDASVNR